MKVDVLTLFPEMFAPVTGSSILGRAGEKGLLYINLINIRDYSSDKHSKADDTPFGGGPGMLLMPDPIFSAIEALQTPGCTRIYMCPDGERLTPQIAAELSQKKHLIILSGHYEGIDQRVRDCLIDREISIGDYVLTNGTLPAAVLADALCRYVKGVLGEENSLTNDSFNGNLLSFPQYTRPAVFRGMEVPQVLMSGNHELISQWRRQQQVEKTKQRRPDILKSKENKQ